MITEKIKFHISDVDIQSQVEGSLLMPPAYGTVVSRAQLALVWRNDNYSGYYLILTYFMYDE